MKSHKFHERKLNFLILYCLLHTLVTDIKGKQYQVGYYTQKNHVFDQSLVEAVQRIAFSGDVRLPFAHI